MHDLDIEIMTRSQLKFEIQKLRNAIRKHRDCSSHNLCWYHPELWNLLPEQSNLKPEVPPTDEFISRCKEYRKSLD